MLPGERPVTRVAPRITTRAACSAHRGAPVAALHQLAHRGTWQGAAVPAVERASGMAQSAVHRNLPMLRSTAQRLFTTCNPRVSGSLLTTSTSIPRLVSCLTTAFLKPVSPRLLEMVGYCPFAWSPRSSAAEGHRSGSGRSCWAAAPALAVVGCWGRESRTAPPELRCLRAVRCCRRRGPPRAACPRSGGRPGRGRSLCRPWRRGRRPLRSGRGCLFHRGMSISRG